MRLVAKFVAATCVVSALGITASVGPAAAQMWDWNNRTQYGPNYDNYGPRYGAPAYQSSGSYDRGWNAGTQYGPNYDNYGPRYGAPRYQSSGNYDRGWNTGTQYGSDYQYYGPRKRSMDRDGWR